MKLHRVDEIIWKSIILTWS